MKLSRPHLVNVARKFINTRTEIDSRAWSLAALYDFDQMGICILTKNTILKIRILTKMIL